MEERNRNPRKPYARPVAEQVPLRPEEAVLGSCKVSSTAGPATPNCGAVTCYSVGS